ncbi:MAG: hypothetical protein Q9191_002612 [Dirinaria sp. TL-2023a]
MHQPQPHEHVCCEECSTCHPNDPIPREPVSIPQVHIRPLTTEHSPPSSSTSQYTSSSEPASPRTPDTDIRVDDSDDSMNEGEMSLRRRRASTQLISQSPADVRRILIGKAETDTKLLEKVCCGGGCCFLDALPEDPASGISRPVPRPDNNAFHSLGLKLGPLSMNSDLTKIAELQPQTVTFSKLSTDITPDRPDIPSALGVERHPPQFVQPHAPWEVYSSKVHHARELTKPGAEKRTYHFDLDVTDYPVETGSVDFVVGGAVGVQAPNSSHLVEEILDLLLIPSHVRDKPVTVQTTTGRWPTIWGDDKPRTLTTTRRALLTWCSDVQSYAPTKALLRLLANYADAPNEKKILLYLSSAQGQAAFCDLRTGPHITLAQLLSAFPSSKPPLPHLLSVLPALMPRFYSLSQDPSISRPTASNSPEKPRRIIEIAVTVHETPNWRGGPRTGVGSGFLERIARKVIEAEEAGISPSSLDLRVPMFRGLMANPLAREFVTDGPMLLIGAGVGIAPFRGFVQKRLRSANCANKVWVLQGVRDSLLDELYSGEWGVDDEKVRKVVQSRRGESRYVQEEVRHQADLVWFVINALDGRVFVCGSSKGMGEGVEKSLVDVAMDKGNLNREEAREFWEKKKGSGHYVAETW